MFSCFFHSQAEIIINVLQFCLDKYGVHTCMSRREKYTAWIQHDQGTSRRMMFLFGTSNIADRLMGTNSIMDIATPLLGFRLYK